MCIRMCACTNAHKCARVSVHNEHDGGDNDGDIDDGGDGDGYV